MDWVMTEVLGSTGSFERGILHLTPGLIGMKGSFCTAAPAPALPPALPRWHFSHTGFEDLPHFLGLMIERPKDQDDVSLHTAVWGFK